MDIIGQVRLVIGELLILIDEGKSVSVAEIEAAADQNNVYEFIEQKFGFKNAEFRNGDQELVKNYLNQEVYISEAKANEVAIQNN